ncbi:protein BPS1, chloroplastic-like [Senna tora]|uniref:Protein BPS1, chloroplastic-like n=1 Tax=Senna tora TaxID=362788 RepID=A0A834TLP3_9FABA|nr:protein BPS1, chloroplastic-like [Senna tora]
MNPTTTYPFLSMPSDPKSPRCFALLPLTHKAFAELVVDIDHPVSRWSPDSVEEYLGYTLRLIELFNSVSSSLSRIGQSRLSLSYGLIKFKKSSSPSHHHHLKGIEIGAGRLKLSPNFGPGEEKSRVSHGKERVIQEAIGELKMIGFWVCGVVLSALSNGDDAKALLELRKAMASGVYSSIDAKISEKMIVLKEVKEINDAVGDLLVVKSSDSDSDAVKAEAAMEVEKKVNGFQKMLDDLSKEVDGVFSKVMTQRNELVDCFRFRKQPHKSVV